MFQIVLEMESDKEKHISAPKDWGETGDEVAQKLCELLESARERDATFISINNVVVRVENVWGARVRPEIKSEGKVIQFPKRR